MRLLLIILLIMLILGCEQSNHLEFNPQSISVTEGMGGKPKPGFARAIDPREFSFPQDHGAHPEYATEWWYFTGNLIDDEGRSFGYQLTIFRIGLEPGEPEQDSPWRTHQVYMGHMAVSDIQSKRHHSGEIFSRAAKKLAGTSQSPFRVWLGPWTIQSQTDNFFPLRVNADYEEISINLSLDEGDKPMVLQGDRGLSQKGAETGNASYYYSYTRLPTSGTISIGKQSFQVKGNSWFDREWSSSALADDQQGWDWFSLQLDDGRDLMFYRMRDTQGNAQKYSKGVLVDVDGQVLQLDLNNTRLEEKSNWRDNQGNSYPLEWRLVLEDLGLDLDIKAFFNDQLMQHTVKYWEGAVNVEGTHTGRGYMELSGYDQIK